MGPDLKEFEVEIRHANLLEKSGSHISTIRNLNFKPISFKYTVIRPGGQMTLFFNKYAFVKN